MNFMSGWNIFTTQKSTYADISVLQQQRSRQIEQLKLLNVGVKEVLKDEEYKIESNVSGVIFVIYIKLPLNFPQEPPEVRLTPPARHQWLNENNVVTGCPSLKNFSVHSDLGKVMKEILDEFRQNPPILVHIHQQVLPYDRSFSIPNKLVASNNGTVPVRYQSMSVNQPRAAVSHSNLWSTQPMNNQYGLTNLGTSSVAASDSSLPTSKLSALSEKELQNLLEDENALLNIVKDFPEIIALEENKRSLYAKNEEIARQNLSLKPLLEKKKQLLLEKYEQLNDSRRRFDENSRLQEVLRKQYEPSLLLANLTIATCEVEQQAESQAEKFLEGSLDVDTFNKQFMKLQMLKYQRKAYEEKLANLIQRTLGST